MRYSFYEMKKLNESKGMCYFSDSSMKAWACKIIDTFENGLFIETIKGAMPRTRVAYVKIFTSDYDVCSLEYFDNVREARKYVNKLLKAFENNLGNREKETLENVTYVRCNENNENEYLEFINDNDKGVSHSFTLNRDLQVVG